MKRKNDFLIIGLLLISMCIFAKERDFNARYIGNNSVSIDTSVFMDKLLGGWVGQMAGVTWGASTEFNYLGQIMPANRVPLWSSSMINDAFGQDDIYVEVPFMDAMKEHGFLCSWTLFGEHFRNTRFGLWHANKAGRDNLRLGILAPESGHYSRNPHCDDIDWQIEADFIGMICPGQPMSAADIAWRAGHVMNYGDGVYGGVFVTAMHSAAFTASTLDEVIEAGRNALPVGSKFREVVEDVIAWKNTGNTWEQNWSNLQNKWGNDDRCPDGKGGIFNIDAKLNSAYILIGLLYGNGDFEETMRIAMRCGQDSDCNPSSAGGILGNWLGLSKIPDKWKSALDRSGRKFSNTDYTLNDLITLSVDLAKKILIFNSGTINDNVWSLPEQEPLPLILEQWPESSNAVPELQTEIISIDSNTAHFHASASDADGILSYQWFFGDLSYGNGAEITHTYNHYGVYEVTCYTTDGIGNTAYQTLSFEMNDPTLPNIRIEAVSSTISEGGAIPGTFRFLREGYQDQQITIHFNIGGTALNGVDYNTIPDSLIILPNQLLAELQIVPVDDNRKKNDKIVQILLKSDVHYNIGLKLSDEITIIDNDTLSAPLEPGLVAYYNFDENTGATVADLSGNSFDGYFVGDAGWVEGKFGGAVEFAGTNNSHIEVPESVLGEGLIFDATDNWSLSLWIKLPAIPTVWTTVVAKSRDVGGHYGFWLAPVGGGESWTFGGYPNYGSVITDEFLDVWTHIVVVQEEGFISGYLNGIENFTTGPARPLTGAGDLWMGGAKSVQEWLVGSIDEVRIYNRALSSTEVTALFAYNPGTVGVKNQPMENSNSFVLNQNYPNPFNYTTNISFDLPKKSEVNISLYDILGQQVAMLVDEVRSKGRHVVQFDGRNLSGGVYLYKMVIGDQVFTKKMQLVK